MRKFPVGKYQDLSAENQYRGSGLWAWLQTQQNILMLIGRSCGFSIWLDQSRVCGNGSDLSQSDRKTQHDLGELGFSPGGITNPTEFSLGRFWPCSVRVSVLMFFCFVFSCAVFLFFLLFFLFYFCLFQYFFLQYTARALVYVCVSCMRTRQWRLIGGGRISGS